MGPKMLTWTWSKAGTKNIEGTETGPRTGISFGPGPGPGQEPGPSPGPRSKTGQGLVKRTKIIKIALKIYLFEF